jgi:hypothetical protein
MSDFVSLLLVIAAVVFFGALISLGNEDQRQAIDALCERATRWVEQDLSLNRARAMGEVRVPNARQYLKGITSRLFSLSP